MINGQESLMSDDEKKEHAWDHAWSTEEIRKRSTNWTLAGDVGLLNHLQDFSHKLISRTMEMEKTVDSLVHKSKVAGAKVNNVINHFQMLSNLQFVENRVYDEEVQEPEPTPSKDVQPKTKEQREAEMLPRIIKALELGISVLDKAFERIEMDESSESDEEEEDDDDVVARRRTILEPKDVYEHRPLPYVIGTFEFQNDDYAGLRSTIDDEPSMESTQEDNVSSSSSSSSSESEEDLDELIASKQPQPVTAPVQHRDTIRSVDTMKAKFSDSESSDLFDGGEEEEENGYISSSPAEKKPEEVSVSNAVNPLMEELMRKSKQVVPSSDKQDKDKPETIQNPVVHTKRKESDDLFGGGGSDDDFFQNDASPFQKKSLFSSNGIFGNEEKSDDEGDLFSEKPDSSEKKPTPIAKVQVLPSPLSKVLPIPTKGISAKVVDDEEDDLFSKVDRSDSSEKKPAPVSKVRVLPSPVSKTKVPQIETAVKQTKSKKEPDLFGDDEDEGDDLFSSLSTQSPASLQRGPSASSKIASSEGSKKSDKSTPSPSVSERSNKSLFDTPKEPSGSVSLFGDDSDSEDLFSSKKITTNQKSFDFNFTADIGGNDDDEDDLFGTKSTSRQSKPAIIAEANKESKPSIKESVSLFDESDSFDLFGPTEPKQKAEDLFVTDVPKPNVKKPDESMKQTRPPVQTQKKPPPSLLFDDNDGFDLFAPAAKTDEKKQKSSNDNKVVGEKPQKQKEQITIPATKNKEVAVEKVTSIKVDEKPQESKEQVPIYTTKNETTVVEKISQQSKSADLFPPHPTENDSSATVSFDSPSDAGSTLSAINKSRAKIQVKRKKPTRKHRQALISADLDEDINRDRNSEVVDESPPTKSLPSSLASSDLFGQVEEKTTKTEHVPSVPPSSNKLPSAHKKEEMGKKNLMSQLMFEAQSSKILKQTVPDVLDNEEDDDDLFSGGSSKKLSADFSVVSPTVQKPDDFSVKTDSKSEGPKLEGSSLLLSDSTSDEDLFSNSAFKDFRNSLSKNSIFEDEDDDIFKSSDNRDNLSRHSSEALGEVGDDIFAGVEKEKYEMFPTQVFDDDDDDDDIFSNLTASSSTKKEIPKGKPKSSKKTQDDLFDDPLGVA